MRHAEWQCRICGERGAFPTYSVKEMMLGLPGHFDYFQCTRCGCLQLGRIPTDLDPFYAGTYYSFSAGRGPVARLYGFLKKLRDAFVFTGTGAVGKALARISPAPEISALRRISLPANARILDVGSGNGALLTRLQSLGFQNLLGIDPYLKEDCERPGVSLRRATLDSIGGGWDLIMFNHSFEHLPEPARILEATKARLRPGGHCLIRLPTVSSWAWEHYREDWVQLDAPRHLYLHSLDSLSHLAKESGFDIVELTFDSTDFQFWGSEQYRAGIRLNSPRSLAVNPLRKLVAQARLRTYRKRAEALNAERLGDSLSLMLRNRG